MQFRATQTVLYNCFNGGLLIVGDGEDVYMLMHKGHNENKYKSVYNN